ncbi:hypothetical protein C5167_004445 [Papaver somniferum]|uniref:Uncharacterized protein n=1 Tax=Papaver somniferum TaxID=3469 RepID=A0A4Y7JB23_PAPSO|nr:hypothetical protein C5167_004445 [Papaver somniferum]
MVVGLRKRKKTPEQQIPKKKTKQQLDDAEIQSLPDELWIENILTRLPARTLAICSLKQTMIIFILDLLPV